MSATLFDAAAGEHGLCRYGHPDNVGKCLRPATHRAVWHQRGDTIERSGGLECCRDHADYYAYAWLPFTFHIGRSDLSTRGVSVWIDILAWEHTA